VEVDETAAEAPLVDQLQSDADAVGQRRGAAADQHRREQQVPVVDESGPDRVGGEIGAGDGEIRSRRRLQPSTKA
jgi:hypothetical protein